MNSTEPTVNNASQASSESGTTTAAPTTEASEAQRRPRTGPIVWGALVLAFCVYVAQQTFAPATVDTTTWLISGVIGLGLLLLVVGIVVLIRGPRRS